MPPPTEHLDQLVLPYARKDFPELRVQFTVQQALDSIRQQGLGEKVIYFYVVDDDSRLVGVLPTRRLLISPLDGRLGDLMIPRVVALPHSATILEACELFVLHKFLAFPVIDEQRRIVGVVDVNLLTEEVLQLDEGEHTDEIFETLGFRISQVRAATPWRAFRLRFPWLVATLTSGMACALLASAFQVTLAKSLLLAFFITLVLALGESISIQSMALAVQGLHSLRPSFRWFLHAFRQEAGTALLLGLGSGAVVTVIICLWRGVGLPAFVIGVSVVISMLGASLFGLCVPALLHWLRLDPRIAAGPVTLACTDAFTLFAYFGVASLVL